MKPTLLTALLIAAFGAGVIAWPHLRGGATVPSGACDATVHAGGDITKAVFEAPEGGTVCLASGTHKAFKTARARRGITVKGAGKDTTVVEADGRDAIDITDIENFTLTGVSVRGGDPAGVYVARARGITLRDVRLDVAAIAIHAESGATLSLADVRITRSGDFGLLVRRSASATVAGLQISDPRGIGIGAVDEPGPVTLRDVDITRGAGSGRGEGMVLNGWQRFALENVTVRGGDPAGIYVARARELSVLHVRVEKAKFGLHIDDNAAATVEDVTLAESGGVGLLVQRGATLSARAVHILDTAGTGFSAINGAGLISLRDSEISRAAAAGLFAGVAGCDDLPAASLEVPDCFLKDPASQISTIHVALDRLSMTDTQGPCLVFFPGVSADVRDSTFTRCEETGLFAWGATADVHHSTFEDNAEHALEYRAFPDPRKPVLRAAFGTIEDSVMHATRPLQGEILGSLGPGPVLGGGILAQGSRLVLRNNEVSANRDIGVSFVNHSSGQMSGNRVTGNGNYAVCLLPDAQVELRDNVITGNRSNDVTVCGGRPN